MDLHLYCPVAVHRRSNGSDYSTHASHAVDDSYIDVVVDIAKRERERERERR